MVDTTLGHAARDDFSNSLNLLNLGIPLMARYNLGYNLNVHAGMQVGLLLSAKSKFQDEKFNVKDQFKTIDIGLPIGAGYEFMDRQFNLTLCYIIGLNDINESTGGKIKNNVLQLSFGTKLFTVNE